MNRQAGAQTARHSSGSHKSDDQKEGRKAQERQETLRDGLKLVVFDCDGVLIDSERPSCRATAQFARSLGLDMSDDEAFKRFAGFAAPQVTQKLEALLGHSLPADTPARLRDGLVDLMTREPAPPMDGARTLLAALTEKNIPVRIGSNSTMAEMDVKFSRTGMDRYLEDERIHSATDLGHPKPSPYVYQEAARREGVSPEETLVIEDSDAGAEAALNAGMSCLLLRADDHPLPAWWPAPHFVRITHLSQALPLIEKHFEKHPAKNLGKPEKAS